MEPSKNAMTARAGNKAEKVLLTSLVFLGLLSSYLGKTIVQLVQPPRGKKTDVTAIADDETRFNIQIKSGNGGGRGHSFDRRCIEKFENKSLMKLLQNVCLNRSRDARIVVRQDNVLIKALLLGDEPEFKPDYFVHVIVSGETITHASICTADEFVDAILKDAYSIVIPKKTCVHLSPLIYLQRKGSEKKDSRPNDIQAKLREIPQCMHDLMLPQTTSPQPEQNNEQH
jgi:hypothetical protein